MQCVVYHCWKLRAYCLESHESSCKESSILSFCFDTIASSWAAVSVLWSHLKELNPSVALHSSWQEELWCSHQVLPARTTGDPTHPRMETSLGARSRQQPALQRVWDGSNMDQRSPVFMLIFNTVQNKMELTFKIKLLDRVIYAQRAPQGKKLWGVSVMKDIIYLCLNRKV